MGNYNMIAQDVQAWRVEDLLEASSKADRNDVPEIIETYYYDDKIAFQPEKNVISIEIRGQMFDAPADYWIVYNHGFFDAVTDLFFQEQFVAGYPEQKTDRSSIGVDELRNRFGSHKATIEGPNASTKIHADLREVFLELAIYLDGALPAGRAKSLALTHLEDASHWSHKTLAAEDPLED